MRPTPPSRRPAAYARLFRLLVALAMLLPGPAMAWWRGGVWIPGPPPPVYVAPPPVYGAPPPVYVGPPPAYAVPPPASYGAPDVAPTQPGVLPGYMVQAPGGPPPPGHRICYAGNYTCPLVGNPAPGAPCACPTGSGPNAYGHAG